MRNGMLLNRIVLPMGSCPSGKSSSTTVLPTMQTLAAFLMSSSEKTEPLVISHCLMSRYSVDSPYMVLEVLLLPLIHCPDDVTSGET